MGEKNNDGGQFFTPREIIRAMIRAVAPQVGEKVYDPCCGTGGFLAQSYEFMRPEAENVVRTPSSFSARRLSTVARRTTSRIPSPSPTSSSTASMIRTSGTGTR